MEFREYTAAVYPRFNGMYYCVKFEDFEARGKNIDPDKLADAQKILTKELQKLVNEYKKAGKVLPENSFKEYDSFSSSYGDECNYYKLKVVIN